MTERDYGKDVDGVPWESALPTEAEVAARKKDLLDEEGNVIGQTWPIPHVWGRIDPTTGEPFK